MMFTDVAGRAISKMIDSPENSASDVAAGAVGVIVDFGHGIADGAAFLWDLF